MSVGNAMDGDADVRDRLEGSLNVLVYSSGMDTGASQAYLEELVPDEPLRVLGVNYLRRPEEWLEQWRTHVPNAEEFAFVAVSDGPAPEVDVPAFARNPNDLTGLGITLGEQLGDWSGGNVTPFLDFHSLTAALQYVDFQRVYRFVHVMTARSAALDALSYYHIDPEAHDEQTVATLTSLFDAAVRYDDGEWHVRTR
ncbi:DUF7504 family protein [Natronomonas sp. EA1]|uniref:DUF7504 family protein n=1 Tax=Natronomonas sp. EA1 TaxID=3421655 RepID=UPI003EBED3A8